MTSLLDHLIAWTGLTRAADLQTAAAASPSPAILPPPRTEPDPLTVLSISTAFRAAQILATSVSQLGIKQYRGDREITPAAIIRKPDANMHRKAFLDYTVTSMALTGNAFWLVTRDPATGQAMNLRALNPTEVAITSRPDQIDPTYSWRGRSYRSSEITHLSYMRVLGLTRGLGPIQAAARELGGMIDARDYRTRQFRDSEYPTGVLTTDQDLAPDQAQLVKKMWRGYNPETDTYEPVGKTIRVLTKGTSYKPLLLSPADMQFLETARFDTTGIARLFGVPASLMLASTDGNSQTYANIEQDWIGYTRFTLTMYTREIELALTDLLPLNNSARFNLDALLRSDTKTRYQAHQLALNAGWKTINEVRADEDMPPLPGGDALPTPRTTSQQPAEEPTNA